MPIPIPPEDELLYRYWDFFGNKPIDPSKEAQKITVEFSLQEKVLLKALIAYFENREERKSALSIVIGYDLDSQERTRTHDVSNVTNEKINEIVTHHKQNPTEAALFLRQALTTIFNDPMISSTTKKTDRLTRYLQSSLTLQVKLDRLSFLPSDKVINKVPSYVPDGLSDMGGDPTINPSEREREKIRVDKAKIFSKYSAQLTKLYLEISNSKLDPDDLKIQGYIAERVSHMVYEALPYDRQCRAGIEGAFLGRSIGVDDIHDKKMAVCRHHALETQVLLQAMGIQAQLFKCNVQFGNGRFGGHAANLVELDGEWFILDTTNPEAIDRSAKVYLKKIDGVTQNPYSDGEEHTYVMDQNSDAQRTYVLRDKMYYRVRDNKNNRLN